ncbi:integrase [Bartonella henselae str. Houston-1]|nr:integrase [Bartonella henselae str. Houston-1]
MQGLSQHFELTKRRMVKGCTLNKCKDGDAQWLYHYIYHRCHRERGNGVLRDASLK